MRPLQAVRIIWFWIGVLTVWVSFAAGWWIGALLR